MAGPVQAVPGVVFDPSGGGGAVAANVTFVDSFDWRAGNTVAADSIPTKGAAGLNVLLLSQSSLASLDFNGAGATVQMNGFGELTYQMSANSLVTAGGAAGSLVWSNNDALPAATTFFQMFHDTTPDSSNITGCGHGLNQVALPGCGLPVGETLILEGTVRLVSMSWTPTGAANTLLDTNGLDDQAGVTTIVATGSANYEINVTFAHTGYFLSNIDALSMTHDMDHAGSTADGFTPGTSNPSDQVVGRIMHDTTSGLTAAATLDAAYGTGRVNGDPTACTVGLCDVHMVSDTATGVLANLPEPGSVALLGLGLGLLGFSARRRKA